MPAAEATALGNARRSGRVPTLYVHWSMADLHFEWDPEKAAANYRKHGVGFDEAVSAFSDEHGLILDDPADSEAEDRFVLLALSGSLRLLVVVHCFRDAAHTIRLISARKATRREGRTYEERWEA